MSEAPVPAVESAIVRPAARFAAEEPECRAEDGIYFADGRVVVLEVFEDVVHVHETTTLTALCEDAPEDWIGLERAVRILAGDYVVSGGGTQWEAEGWIALQMASDGALVWLLKLEGGEAVTAIHREGDAIVARSEAYPLVVEWQIPIAEPEKLTIERYRSEVPTIGRPRALA